ncbi:T9SS type A sorting domain-containing protein [Neotamlana laminarinivorans]|uniref:T9SS type A sorting domain-containing protein n=1 Tax=Neotamlana laminarinivorans TaxID=2883124 RepID=A0A9X1I3P9_9FLAO|nr:T9SS type A sorting domain-containing protein [Tamlana laminarinivorans]MCB4799419.1 T9SS type A sorting domain-containing protein [Tamlana laminarinivorans]
MIRYCIFITFSICVFQLNAQNVTTSAKFTFPEIASETSGLLYINNKLITHNDSGNSAELYEFNIIGNLERTITINNATNFDWEDLGEDDNYIYIGDIGNNFGNRTDLKFYRVLKSEFNSSNSVNAEIINYTYENQTSFTSKLNDNNWDAEAFVVYNDYLLIFTKNWENNEVDVYALPKTIGTHTAKKVSNFNVQGLVTGADMAGPNKIYLSGYSEDQIIPFLFEIYNLNITTPSNLNVFENSNTARLDNFIPFGNQVEGICFIESNENTDTLYLSNEKLTYNVFTFPSKLREIIIDNSTLAPKKNIEADSLNIYPNPFKNEIKLNKKADSIKIYNKIGQCILQQNKSDIIKTASLKSGLYFISIEQENKRFIKKMIK